jgi:hypothetical protein
LGKRFFYDPIDITRIGMVTWHAGQASSRTGRDCDDWSVAVWYVKAQDGDVGEWSQLQWRQKGIQTVAHYLPKQKAHTIGLSVVELLLNAGVPLVSAGAKGDFGVEFVVRGASKVSS